MTLKEYEALVEFKKQFEKGKFVQLGEYDGFYAPDDALIKLTETITYGIMKIKELEDKIDGINRITLIEFYRYRKSLYWYNRSKI